MGKGDAALGFLAVVAIVGLIGLAVDEASKIDCRECGHRHKSNDAHTWSFP